VGAVHSARGSGRLTLKPAGLGQLVGGDERSFTNTVKQVGERFLPIERERQNPNEVEKLVVPFICPCSGAGAVEGARGRRGSPGALGRPLEDELCGLTWDGKYHGPGASPDRADAMVWAMTELMLGPPPLEPRILRL
jgi:hypothetical protein